MSMYVEDDVREVLVTKHHHAFGNVWVVESLMDPGMHG